MCWPWCRRNAEEDEADEPLLPVFTIGEVSSSSTSSMGEEPDTVPMLTLDDVFSSDEQVIELEAKTPREDVMCRICWGSIMATVEVKDARQAFCLEDETYAPLCDCTSMPYHVACLWKQLSVWSNRTDWDRTCDVCNQPWRFVVDALPSNFDAPLHTWVRWCEDESLFRVCKRGDDGTFIEKLMDGVEIRVGPGYQSTPDGPLIPMAEAYTTVELHLPEPHEGRYAIYFDASGRVARRIPWPTVYLLLLSSSG
jgi:hypothetical protein